MSRLNSWVEYGAIRGDGNSLDPGPLFWLQREGAGLDWKWKWKEYPWRVREMEMELEMAMGVDRQADTDTDCLLPKTQKKDHKRHKKTKTKNRAGQSRSRLETQWGTSGFEDGRGSVVEARCRRSFRRGVCWAAALSG